MKILVDGTPLTRHISGIGRVTYEVCQQFLKSDQVDQLIVLAPQPLHAHFRDLSHVTIVKKCFRAFWYGGYLGLLIKRFEPDIFIAFAPRLPWFAPSQIPTMILVHDLIWALFPRTLPIQRRLYEQILFRAAIGKAARIACVSSSTKHDLLEKFPCTSGKTEVITLSSSQVPEDSSEDQRYILWVGTFEPRKNLACLVEAYGKMPPELLAEYRLVLAGNKGWGGDVLMKTIERNNVQERVVIICCPTDIQLAELYRRCTLFVLPSLHEGFGLPAIEAMTYGKPLVVSNRGALPEVCGDAAIYINPSEPQGITDAMVSLISDSDLYAAKCSQSKLKRSDYSWVKTSDQLVKIISGLIN